MARILIVDDEPAIRLLLARILSREGFDIQTAGDAIEAMAICATERFDLVLSDVGMPEMDGHKLAQWVAENYPATKTALMSGYDTGCRGCPLLAALQASSEAVHAGRRDCFCAGHLGAEWGSGDSARLTAEFGGLNGVSATLTMAPIAGVFEDDDRDSTQFDLGHRSYPAHLRARPPGVGATRPRLFNIRCLSVSGLWCHYPTRTRGTVIVAAFGCTIGLRPRSSCS